MERLNCGVRLLLAGVVVLTVSACQVDQTRPAAMPEVDVDVDPGRWPAYDVDWADVDVGTQERTITVPVVRVEGTPREITVPYIDIRPPGARDVEERTLSLELDVPHAGYQMVISEVRASGDDLWVVGTLAEEDASAAKGMTRVSDQVVIKAPEDLDVRKVIVGPQPDGVYNRQYRFVDSTTDLDGVIPEGARVIYKRGTRPAA